MHFWDAGQCSFDLMMDSSFSFSHFLTPISRAINGKHVGEEIQHGRFQSDVKIPLHPLGVSEVRSCFTTVQTNTKTNQSAATQIPLSYVKEVTTVCGDTLVKQTNCN